MNYRVVTINRIYSFNSFSEAKSFSMEKGGTVYIKECSCIYER